LTLSDTAFTCADAGVNAVTLTVTDASGNSSFCNSNVTVLDTTAPMAMCQDVTVFLNAIGSASIIVGDVDNGSSDNCAISTMTISQSSFDCSHLGANTITLTVTDNSGNVSTCTSTVTVIDNIAPTAICQDITVYLDSTGNVTIDSTDTDNGSTDNCSIVTMSLSQTAFDCSHVGIANTVTVTVTDQSGNVSTCTSTVTVIDNVNPTAICQDATVYLDATGNITISATDVDGGSNDACGITMTISDSLFNCVDTGSNTVTLFVTDASGNVSLCNSNVTVLDTLNPIVICNSPTVYLDALGNVSITAAQIDNGSTDNCTIASIVISDTTFDCSNLGTNSVTLIVTDVSGNVDSCISTVTVVDTINPIARCKSATVYLNSLGTVIITSLDVDNGSTDNCNITTLTLSRTSFTCSEVGPNNVTLTVTDPSGNVNSCVAIVTVLDTLAPTAVCQNITIKLDSNGSASIVALDVEGGSFDNCGIASIVVNKTNFDCSNLGANTVILTVTDLYGNASTCSANVTVEDDIAPIVYCPADKQRVVKNTNCAYIVEDFIGEIAIWDNCSSDDVVLTQSPAAGTELLLENVSQTITITAIDANGTGNSSTCSFEVYVRCVKQLDIPQFISPNGDGLNDTWEIPELAIYPGNTVKVFNRWGNLVFEQKGYYTGWNGSANVNRGLTRLMDNKTLPEGTYFYIIDLGDGVSIEPYNGFLQLKR
jgi:gliding motility-associated-like protein